MSSDKDKTPLSTPDASAAGRPAPDSAASAAPARPAPALPSHSLFRPGRADGHDEHHDDPHDDHASGGGRYHHDEADHSMTDFDLGREIDARFDRNAWAAVASSGASVAPSASGANSSASLINAGTEHDDDYFPEDERSSMDWESDHSMTDFDLREELFNRLGEAPPEEAPPAPSAPASEPSDAAPAHAAGAPDGDDEPHDGYYPEDERSSLDWEDDHSMAGFDLEREVAEQAQKAANSGPAGANGVPAANGLPAAGNGAPAAVGVAGAGGFPAAAGVCGVSIAAGAGRADAHDPDYFPEDERSSMDWESDHSTAEFDLNAEIDSRLGKGQPAPQAGAGPDASARPAPGAGAQGAASDKGYVHPGLAASLSASLAYAQRGLQDDAAGNSSGKDSGKSWRKDTGNDTDKSAAKSTAGAPCPVSSAAADNASAPAAALAGAGGNSVPAASGGKEEEKKRPFDGAGTVPAGVDTPVGAGASARAGASASASAGKGDPAGKDAPVKVDAPAGVDAPVGDGTPPGDDAPAGAGAPAAGDDDGKKERADDAPALAGGGMPPAVPPATDDDDDEEEDDEEEDGEDDGDEKEDDGGLGRPMTLRDHLTEMRKRITRAFLWMVVGFAVCYPFAEKIFKLLFAPLTRVLPNDGRLIYTSPPEAFFTYMKVAFVAGIFLTSPMIFYQIWAFVAPGLYKEEKAHVVPVAVFSALFFICGGAFCYFVAFPFAFEFFMSYSTDLIVAMPALSETLSFVLQLLLAFGLIFELPLFVFFLARLGIVTADMMRKFRRYSILVNVIIAAILTPPDVMSQMLMAGPLVLLYEFSVLIAAVFGKKKPAPAEEEEDEDGEDDEEEDDDLEDDGGDDDEDEGGEKAPAPAKP